MAATLPLLVSALKPHSSHFSLFFAGARNPWLCLFKPPPERHRLVEIWSPRQIAPLQFNNHSVLRQNRTARVKMSRQSKTTRILGVGWMCRNAMQQHGVILVDFKLVTC
ncbi:hypothetical protein ACOSQ4_003658 [Xanthoceras sorbifolium]